MHLSIIHWEDDGNLFMWVWSCELRFYWEKYI